MRQNAAEPEQEVKRLQRCISDLVSVLALPAAWNNSEPSRILETFLDALVELLDLNFLYARARVTSHEAPIEVLRTADSDEVRDSRDQIRQALHQWLGQDIPDSVPAIQRLMGRPEISIFPLRLGIEGSLGLIIVGCQRLDFPQQTERLVMTVAANQIAVMLQQAQLMSEQRRVAKELDERVAQRTSELAAANQKLRIEIAERKEIEERLRESERESRLIVDSIPGRIAVLNANGQVERLNQPILDYYGKSAEELNRWSLDDTIHPEDRPASIHAFAQSLITGDPTEFEMRLRRFDGVYRWFQLRGRPLRDRDGRVVRWYYIQTDVDERRLAEDALKSRERNLKLIIDTIPALVWSTNPDGSVDFFNQHYLDYTGLSLEQARGWSWRNTVHPDDLDHVVSHWRQVLASGEPGEGEERLRRHDGTYRWFFYRVCPLLDDNGDVLKWYGTLIDIEDRKLAEQALLESERTLFETVNNIPGLVARTNEKGELEFLNHQTLVYFGKSIEEMESWALDGTIHPDDVSGVVEARKKPVEEGRTHDYEVRCRRADGVYRWFQVRGGLPANNTSGPPARRYVLLVDIEDRKQAEEKLRRNEELLKKAQRLSLSGCFSWRVDTDEVTCSEEALRIYGFEPDTRVTIQTLAGLIHPDDRPVLAEKIGGARRVGGDQDYGIRLQMPDSSVKYLRVSSQETRGESGRREYIGAIQDVTARHIAEEALSIARAELAHMSRVTSLSALTASIAHEINQPLSGIITNANTCLRMLDSVSPNIDGARETARRTLRDGNRASEVIVRLRTLFNRKEVVAEAVDLSEAAREVVALSLSELQRSGVFLQHEFADNLPVVKGDRIQLQQVILNLLRNALDAMDSVDNPPKRLVITTEKDGEQVRLVVRDSGAGFQPAVADRLFEPFYTTKREGMGIGLSVSRSIVEAHGGRMWATPNDGPGATFAFSIPCDYSHHSSNERGSENMLTHQNTDT